MTLSRREALTLLGAAVMLPGLTAAANADEVLAADRAFNDMAQKDGVLAAFLAYASEDAVKLGPGAIRRGKAGVREEFKDFPDTVKLIWGPEGGMISGAADFGFSWGLWRMIRPGKPDMTGNYCTVWRKEAGAWKFVCDTGNADPVA